jgi:hypothetical protein
MFTYIAQPQLPAVPQKFIDRAFTLIDNQPEDDCAISKNMYTSDWKNRKVLHNGILKSTRVQKVFELGADWDEWIRSHITNEWVESGVRLSDAETDLHAAHTDYNPLVKLYYPLERGGEYAITRWYQEKNQPIVRNPRTSVNDMNSVDVISEIQFEIGRWYLFNTQILHGVENLQGRRVSIQISMSPDSTFISRFTK